MRLWLSLQNMLLFDKTIFVLKTHQNELLHFCFSRFFEFFIFFILVVSNFDSGQKKTCAIKLDTIMSEFLYTHRKILNGPKNCYVYRFLYWCFLYDFMIATLSGKCVHGTNFWSKFIDKSVIYWCIFLVKFTFDLSHLKSQSHYWSLHKILKYISVC